MASRGMLRHEVARRAGAALVALALLGGLGAGCGVTVEEPTITERCAFYREVLANARSRRSPYYVAIAERYRSVCSGVR